MQHKYFKFLLILFIAVLVVPSVALAAWWNPFSWNWNIMSWFKAPTTQTQTQKPADLTANWKTFKNAQYGFEFNYPNSQQWDALKEETHAWSVIVSLGDYFDVRTYPDEIYGKTVTFRQIMDDYIAQIKKEGSNFTVENISVNGINGKEFYYNPIKSGVQTNDFQAYFPIGDTSYVVFGAVQFPDEATFLTKDTFNKIISTFKLTGSANPAPIVVGDDRDSHGCIGSAGYTWCEVKQKCLRTWEEQCQ